MAKTAGPWYRKQGDAWYVCVHGKQILLAKGKANRAEATKAFHRLMLEGGQQPKGAAALTVAEVCDLFLEDLHRRLSRDEVVATHVENYRRHLQSFAEHAGRRSARDLRPLHVDGWLDAHDWGRNNRHGAMTAVKAVFRWAARQGHLDADPIANLKKPGTVPREAIMTDDQVRAILASTKDEAWRDFLAVLWSCGCRPGELAKVTRKELDADRGRLVFPARRNKTGRKTGRPRIVYLTDTARATCSKWAARNPDGAIFRNLRGNPWTRNAMALRFRRIREKLGFGKEATAYSLRHQFTTSALEAGVPIATVSELLGHRDSAMISRVYGHLADRHEHLRDAAAKIRPDDSS